MKQVEAYLFFVFLQQKFSSGYTFLPLFPQLFLSHSFRLFVFFNILGNAFLPITVSSYTGLGKATADARDIQTWK